VVFVFNLPYPSYPKLIVFPIDVIDFTPQLLEYEQEITCEPFSYTETLLPTPSVTAFLVLESG